ncbi:MAG: winged helix-turn-helix transcriptional regulator [Bradyrhizobiaceae bacterium]|nr:winged helix-turn-helix transcriptional regulator [Bradyrhizobiaceae bacterium]
MVATRTRARKSVRLNGAANRRPEQFVASAEDPWINPGKDGKNLTVSEFPTYTLGRLTGIVRRSFMPAYVDPFGLSIPEWRVMAAIVSRSSLSFNEICSTITMDRAQVSRTLAALVAKGLAAQLTAARAEHRSRGQGMTQTKVILTAKGTRIYRRILPTAQKHQMILLSVLDNHERSVVRRALRKMLAAAQKHEAQRSATATARTKSRKVSPKRTRSGSQRISAQGNSGRTQGNGRRYANTRERIDL